MIKSFARHHWVLWLFIALLIAMAVPVWLGGADVFIRIRQVPGYWLTGLLLLIFTAINFNVLRYRMMLRAHNVAITHGQGLCMLLALAFLANVTPGSVGAPAGTFIMLRRHRVPASVTAAVLMLAGFMDALVVLALLVWASAHVLMGYSGISSGWQAMIPVILLCVGGIVFWQTAIHHRWLMRLTGRILGKFDVSDRWRRRLARQALGFRDAMRALLGLPRRQLLLMLFFTAAHRLLHYSVIFLAVWALGGSIGWVQGFMVQLLALGTARLFFLPAGVGGAEVVAAALLAPTLPAEVAAGAILIWRFVTYYVFLPVGGLALLLLAGTGSRSLVRGSMSLPAVAVRRTTKADKP